MLNYNIRRIIFDKVVLNRWKSGIKKIIKEYKARITWYENSRFGGNFYLRYNIICKVCNIKNDFIVGSRNVDILGKFRCGYSFLVCRNCSDNKRHLPKKYWYSSGKNHPTAYKKN